MVFSSSTTRMRALELPGIGGLRFLSPTKWSRGRAPDASRRRAAAGRTCYRQRWRRNRAGGESPAPWLARPWLRAFARAPRGNARTALVRGAAETALAEGEDGMPLALRSLPP